MPSCVVTGTLKDLGNIAVVGANITARVLVPVVLSDNTIVPPKETAVATDASGNFTMTLEQTVPVLFVINYPPTSTDARRSAAYSALIPATASANFAAVIILE
jgi:hypothetical protein